MTPNSTSRRNILPSLMIGLASFFLALRSEFASVHAFTVTPSLASSRSSSSSTRLFEMEQIEFKIFPDGRVEEIVRGVKGNNCHKVTEDINNALGKVVASQPTEEMYEQELVVEQTLTETLGESTSGGNSWDGQSTW